MRDYQKFSVTSGKNWPGTGPLGPWIVTADEIPDPTKLTLTTRLNGQEVQHSGTDQLIYSCQQIVASARISRSCIPAMSSPPARRKASAMAASRRSG